MLFFASEPLEPFDDPRPWTHLCQLQTPGNDGDTEGDPDTDTQQGDPHVGTDGTKPRKLSARERLKKLSSLRIYPNTLNFIPLGPCGKGGKAEVVKATFRRRIWNFSKQVAVKKLGHYMSMEQHRFSNEFAHEVELMAGLSHENIIELIGFVEDFQNGQAWIVMPWEPNGNVSEFLATGRWEIPERISLDTFEGLKYLHTRQPPICHGDLKSLNILVSSSYRAILTDFGSARVMREPADRGLVEGSNRVAKSNPTAQEHRPQIQVTSTGNQLTLTGPAWSLRWAPPEVVNGDYPGLPSDVWSSGWVCWEIMTNKLPFPELQSSGAITLNVIQGKVPLVIEDEQLSQIVRFAA